MPKSQTREPATKRALDIAVVTRLADLWQSGTQRGRGETAGFLVAEIERVLTAWVAQEA